MGRKTVVLMPQSSRILQDMGNQIKLARLRRRISVDLVAERAGVSRASVWAVEKGSPSWQSEFMLLFSMELIIWIGIFLKLPETTSSAACFKIWACRLADEKRIDCYGSE